MIIYFSATGNSAYVAHTIAERIGEKAVSIKEAPENLQLDEGEGLGIVFPVYFWNLPPIVEEYMQKLQLAEKRPAYLYCVATYGSSCGAVGIQMRSHFSVRDMEMDAGYSIKMPDTWTPMFDVSSKEKVEQQNKEAADAIEEVIVAVKNRRQGDFMGKEKYFLTALAARIFFEHRRKTKNFKVSDDCIGCGLCSKVCTDQIIKMKKTPKGNRPTWNSQRCQMCLACLHHCPTFAISCGNNTKKHGQYIHPIGDQYLR